VRGGRLNCSLFKSVASCNCAAIVQCVVSGEWSFETVELSEAPMERQGRVWSSVFSSPQ
jgi:hypothetical protein